MNAIQQGVTRGEFLLALTKSIDALTRAFDSTTLERWEQRDFTYIQRQLLNANRYHIAAIEKLNLVCVEDSMTPRGECTHNWLQGYCDLCGAVKPAE